jgi:hypothetical protein
MSPDDPGVMGNLPRSRPGRRSAKRAGAAETTAAKTSETKPAASRPAKRTTSSGTAKAAKPRSSSTRTRPRTTQRPKPAEPSTPRQQPQAEVQGGTDPVTGAVMLAGKVVEGGLKVASGVAGGIIKRLPRP